MIAVLPCLVSFVKPPEFGCNHRIYMKIATIARSFRRRSYRRASAFQWLPLAALGLSLTAFRALSDDTMSNPAAGTSSDGDFILAATQDGVTGVKLGEMASMTSVRSQVTSFGLMMMKEDTAMNDELKALAARRGITLADSLDESHQKLVYKLDPLVGWAFDRTYVAAMAKALRQEEDLFQYEAASTQDPDLRDFANRALPVIAEQLQQIEEVKQAL